MTVWSAIIHELGALIRKIGAPLFAFLAGRKSQKEKERAKDDKATIKDLERRLDAAREIDRASRDTGNRERVQRDYTRPDPPSE